ncbi:MAG: hypothetical protein SF028_02050 [Candidatus Sumerlaeia bacterium]|nr:hypothetical protein [Candidatus Sumerlaeia bacterium]
MVFSSIIFLFYFLPAVLLGYFLIRASLQNFLLLCASLLFYSWGEGGYVLLMIASIVANYLFGLGIHRSREGPFGKPLMAVAILFNLGLLGYYKYAGFFYDSVLQRFAQGIASEDGFTAPHLPIGISFFTFQTLSYLVDVFRGETKVQRNPLHLAACRTLAPRSLARG